MKTLVWKFCCHQVLFLPLLWTIIINLNSLSFIFLKKLMPLEWAHFTNLFFSHKSLIPTSNNFSAFIFKCWTLFLSFFFHWSLNMLHMWRSDYSLNIYFGMIKRATPSIIAFSHYQKEKFDTSKLLNCLIFIWKSYGSCFFSFKLFKKMPTLLYFNLMVDWDYLYKYICLQFIIVNSYFIFCNIWYLKLTFI